MSAETKNESALQTTEQRLKNALVEEANRWAQHEPKRLAAACRAPRQARSASRSPVLFRAVTAAGIVLLVAGSVALFLRDARLRQSANRPAVVTPVADCKALYAALPKIPAPPRPPPPAIR